MHGSKGTVSVWVGVSQAELKFFVGCHNDISWSLHIVIADVQKVIL